MEIILSKQCESLTGSLGKGFGYFIQRRRGQDGKYHFFSQRSKHPPIPINGHLRFIFALKKKNFTMRLPKRTIGSQPGAYVSRFTMPETSLTSKSPLAYDLQRCAL